MQTPYFEMGKDYSISIYKYLLMLGYIRISDRKFHIIVWLGSPSQWRKWTKLALTIAKVNTQYITLIADFPITEIHTELNTDPVLLKQYFYHGIFHKIRSLKDDQTHYLNFIFSFQQSKKTMKWSYRSSTSSTRWSSIKWRGRSSSSRRRHQHILSIWCTTKMPRSAKSVITHWI